MDKYFESYYRVSKELQYFSTRDVAHATELNNQTIRNCRDHNHYTKDYNLIKIAEVIGVSL